MTSTKLPATMKTLLQASRKTQEVILTTAPVPVPTHPQDVLVRVHAASPCNGELTWAINFPESIPQEKILVPCQDLAGTVITPPADNAAFNFVPGDRVYCRIDASRAGSARDYALPRAVELAKIPPSLNWIDAAATPLSALTAWQALFVQGTLDKAALKGDAKAREHNAKIRVLVTGATGAVGSWVVQFAALAGAKAVVAVCSGDKEEAARKLGATEVVDYRTVSTEDWVKVDPAAREVDLVIGLVGGKSLAGCWSALREGGAIISVTVPPDAVKPAGLEKKASKSLFFIVETLGSDLAEIGELIEAGKARPTVDSVWEFADFKKAFARMDSGLANGKIIIKVSDEA
ncbi:Reticulon-4-interacting protein 1, mitochondrial [Podospora aff. communis PSN243]|uniref:Reticulon-4-interacting protein 1, mitochondrial n=1 Tax=Podospora aff. communis PSN243 TaxID=3040156 RepID=A0AAV9G5P0_9PEZI|nr:Reticulon-4-interacting protein 1, mitochondrial [Podospora aff. communis PSN243]